MAERVFFHVGALKSGTTYLQQVMWANRHRLRDAGVLIPGRDYRDRVWATQTVRELPAVHPRAARAWDIIVEETRAFPGDVIISHEFFGVATSDQAKKAMDAVRPAEVHVVYSVRDLVRVFPALWQESVKFRHAGRLRDFDPEPASVGPLAHFSWAGIDAVGALQRWGESLPPSRVHVVTVPPSTAPPETLWHRFAAACRFDPGVASLDVAHSNESMGAVEAELLRRVNPRLGEEIRGPKEVPRWVRSYLGVQTLAARRGQKFGLSPERAAEMRSRSVEVAEELRRAGYDIVGDLADLSAEVETTLPGDPDAVGDSELLDTALDVIAQMLSDYRQVSLERQELRRSLARMRREAASTSAPRGSARSQWRRWIRRVRRGRGADESA